MAYLKKKIHDYQISHIIITYIIHLDLHSLT